MELASDPRYLGGRPAIMATLHNWSRDLNDHPHLHLLVSVVGLSPDGERWIEPRYRRWLAPARLLSVRIEKTSEKK